MKKDTIIQNINTVQFKSQEQDLINQQKLMSLTESKIMSTESNLNKEIFYFNFISNSSCCLSNFFK